MTVSAYVSYFAKSYLTITRSTTSDFNILLKKQVFRQRQWHSSFMKHSYI